MQKTQESALLAAIVEAWARTESPCTVLGFLHVHPHLVKLISCLNFSRNSSLFFRSAAISLGPGEQTHKRRRSRRRQKKRHEGTSMIETRKGRAKSKGPFYGLTDRDSRMPELHQDMRSEKGARKNSREFSPPKKHV